MVPQVLSLIQVSVPQAGRARALGIYAAVISLAAVGGQILGGLLVTLDLFGTSWRPIFLVNVPIGLVLLWLGAGNLPADEPRPGRGLDLPGLLTLSLATSLVVVPLVLERGWVFMIAGALVLAGFVLIQRRAEHPLIPSHLLGVPGSWRRRWRSSGSWPSYGGFLFSNALHPQNDLPRLRLRAGLTFVPMAAAFAPGVFCAMTGRLSPGKRPSSAGRLRNERGRSAGGRFGRPPAGNGAIEEFLVALLQGTALLSESA